MIDIVRATALGILLATSASAGGLYPHLANLDSREFPTIHTTLTVFSEQGRPVSGLTRESFELSEDGSPITTMTVEVEKAPLSVCLVLDRSGSMAPAMDTLRNAVGEFVRSLEEHDRVMVVSFSDSSWVDAAFTHDRQKVLKAVRGLEPQGATAFYDGLIKGLKACKDESGRRMVLAFTDGRDQNAEGTGMQSAYGAKAVIQASREARAPVWVIGLGKDLDKPLLTKLTRLTGGGVYMAGQAAQLRKAFSLALADIRLQYHVSYVTPKPARDGKERTVRAISRSGGQDGNVEQKYTAPGEEPVKVAGDPAKKIPGSAKGLPEKPPEGMAQIQFYGIDSELEAWEYRVGREPKPTNFYKTESGGKVDTLAFADTPRGPVYYLDVTPGYCLIEIWHNSDKPYERSMKIGRGEAFEAYVNSSAVTSGQHTCSAGYKPIPGMSQIHLYGLDENEKWEYFVGTADKGASFYNQESAGSCYGLPYGETDQGGVYMVDVTPGNTMLRVWRNSEELLKRTFDLEAGSAMPIEIRQRRSSSPENEE